MSLTTKRGRSPSNAQLPDQISKKMKPYLSASKETSKFSDLVVHCADKTWYIHRVMVCPQSEFFNAACTGGFEESTSQIIQLEDDDPHIVGLMMDFFYTGEYDARQKVYCLGDANDSPLSVHALVYACADKFTAFELKGYARSKTIIELEVDRYSWVDFSNAIRLTWTSTPTSDTELRGLYVEEFLTVSNEVYNHVTIRDSDRKLVLADIEATPGFLFDVAMAEKKWFALKEME